MMDRRGFLLTSVAGTLAPRTVHAQPPTLPVIGFLNGASAALTQNYVSPFREGLREASYVEGRNVLIEFRYVGRILNGAKPSDLPVQQSTRAEFFINLRTVKALDLTVPPALTLRADELIE